MWLESCLWCWWAWRCCTRSTVYCLRCSRAAWRTSATTAATGANSAARAWAVWYVFAFPPRSRSRSRKRSFALFACSRLSNAVWHSRFGEHTQIEYKVQVMEYWHWLACTSAYHLLMPECSVSNLPQLPHYWHAWSTVLCRLMSLQCSFVLVRTRHLFYNTVELLQYTWVIDASDGYKSTKHVLDLFGWFAPVRSI